MAKIKATQTLRSVPIVQVPFGQQAATLHFITKISSTWVDNNGVIPKVQAEASPPMCVSF
jgi:hypothetical protein